MTRGIRAKVHFDDTVQLLSSHLTIVKQRYRLAKYYLVIKLLGVHATDMSSPFGYNTDFVERPSNADPQSANP
jgi:hypothetical protein